MLTQGLYTFIEFGTKDNLISIQYVDVSSRTVMRLFIINSSFHKTDEQFNCHVTFLAPSSHARMRALYMKQFSGLVCLFLYLSP